MKKNYFAVLIAFSFALNASAQVYSDVAGIFYNRCATCHHQGGGAHFALTGYTQVSPWCLTIQTDLNNSVMPPWSPDTTYSRFLYERIITPTEKNAILNWIGSGCQQGDTTLAPTPPVFPQYQLYGTPSLTLTIPVFASNAAGDDAYNCFSLPTGLLQDRWLRAYEIIPGNPDIVHHVIVNVDTVGNTTNDLSGSCFNAPGNFSMGGYAPGAAPTVFPAIAPLKAGIRIKVGSRIVLQIHYPAGTFGQQDSTTIRMYFYPIGETGIRPVFVATPLQNWSLYIPANTVQTFSASYAVLAPISLYAVFPHSHKVCTSIINYANNGTDTIPLIRINKWNFAWQGFYTYRSPVKIPAGYTLRSRHVYDNTTANPNNPNTPPQNVYAGTSTTDEMLFDAIMYLLYQPGDENINIASLLQGDTLLFPTSVHEKQSVKNDIVIYPNPAANELSIINYQLSINEIEIYDVVGKKIFSQVSNLKPQISIDISQLKNGIYFIKASTAKESVFKRVVVER